jgi:hypothetical protein
MLLRRATPRHLAHPPAAPRPRRCCSPLFSRLQENGTDTFERLTALLQQEHARQQAACALAAAGGFEPRGDTWARSNSGAGACPGLLGIGVFGDGPPPGQPALQQASMPMHDAQLQLQLPTPRARGRTSDPSGVGLPTSQPVTFPQLVQQWQARARCTPK